MHSGKVHVLRNNTPKMFLILFISSPHLRRCLIHQITWFRGNYSPQPILWTDSKMELKFDPSKFYVKLLLETIFHQRTLKIRSFFKGLFSIRFLIKNTVLTRLSFVSLSSYDELRLIRYQKLDIFAMERLIFYKSP